MIINDAILLCFPVSKEELIRVVSEGYNKEAGQVSLKNILDIS